MTAFFVTMTRYALGNALLCDEEQELIVRKLLNREHCGDFFTVFQLKQVYDVHALGRAAGLRNLVALELVDLAAVGEEQNVIMAVRGKQLGHDVLVAAGHAGNAAPAAALRVVRVERLALRVAEVRQRDDAALVRDQVFDVHFAADRRDFGAALVVKLRFDRERLLLDNGEHAALVGKDVLQVFDLEVQRAQLVLQLLAVQAGQRAQLHLHDSLRLHIVQAEPLGHALARLGAVLGGADDRDHFVDEIDRNFEALQDVRAVLGLFELKARAACDDVLLEVDVILQNFLERQGLWLAVHNGQHDDAEGILKLGMLKELI